MNQLSLDKPAGILVKTTCVDYPGHLAGSFFLRGCNLRCPYCYNINLVEAHNDEELVSITDLFAHLEKRQGILSALVISGGEPLINPYTPIIIKKARELGYKIKLDTNGTLPDELDSFLNSKELCPDFLAIDIKTTPGKYATKICNIHSPFYGNSDYFKAKLSESCKLAQKMSVENREFRTVLVPDLVSKAEIPVLAAFLPKDATWQFAQFQNKNCLNPQYNNISPYVDSEVQEIIETAKTYIPNSNLR